MKARVLIVAAPHALATAIDSLYGAWLKVNYPLEYYTVVFRYYKDDMERTNKLTKELDYFEIKLRNIKFRYSSGTYHMDKETNTIYKGVNSIKFLSSDVSDQLYALRDQHFDSFFDLLDVFPGNSKQLSILIKLNYFSEFGGSLKLLKIAELYDTYKGKKIIKKDKCDLPPELVQKYAASETAKQYRFEQENMDMLIHELAEQIPDEDLPLAERLKAELEYLGYLSYVNPNMRNTSFVTNVDVKYSPKITMYLLDSGETVTYKLSKAAYQRNAFDVGVFLKFFSEERHKSRKVDGEWIKLDEKEKWITSYITKSDL